MRQKAIIMIHICLEKMDIFFNHQIKVHFRNIKHIRDRIKYWKKPGLFSCSRHLGFLLSNCFRQITKCS